MHKICWQELSFILKFLCICQGPMSKYSMTFIHFSDAITLTKITVLKAKTLFHSVCYCSVTFGWCLICMCPTIGSDRSTSRHYVHRIDIMMADLGFSHIVDSCLESRMSRLICVFNSLTPGRCRCNHKLTHWGLMMPFGHIDLGQHWLR